MVHRGQCQHQRRQKPDGSAGARCLANLDEHGQHAQKRLIGGDQSKVHDVGCHIVHNACVAQRGANRQREVIVPTPATSSLKHGLTWGAWGHPGLPHTRLDCTVVDEGAHHYSSAIRKGQEEAPAAAQAEASENEQVRESEGRSWSHWHLPAAQRTIRPVVGHAPSHACEVQQSSLQRWRTTTARVAKTSERSAGEVHRLDSPLGHRAHGLERDDVRTCSVSFTCTV